MLLKKRNHNDNNILKTYVFGNFGLYQLQGENSEYITKKLSCLYLKYGESITVILIFNFFIFLSRYRYLKKRIK